MKIKIYPALAAIAIMALFSCTKIKEISSIDVAMTLPTTHFEFSQEMKSGEEILYDGFIYVNLDSILNHYGFSAGIIQNTCFTNLSVTIEDPPDATFDWLYSARAVVSGNPTFVPENQIGTVVNNDPDAKTVTVVLDNINIRPYLDNPSFYLRVYADLAGPLPDSVVGMFIDGTVQFRIEPL